MPKTLLQIVNQVQGSLGLPQSATIIGNTDPTTVQMLNLLIDLTTELRRMHRWTNCQWEYIIEVSPATVFTGNVAANSGLVTGITPSTTAVAAWTYQCQFPGIPTPARILEVNSSSSLTLSLVSPTAQSNVSFTAAQDTYLVPTDFDFFINRTMWDRTNRWELLGPDTPQMDQWHQSGVVPTGPRRHFRKLSPYMNNGQFRLWPAPYEIASNLQLVFEYSSNLCVATAGNFAVPTGASFDQPSNFSSTWTTDTDQSVLDDDLLIKGLEWKVWQRKGFNYQDMKNDWIDYVDQQWARDGARPTLNIVKRVNPVFISPSNVQDGFFPGPAGPNSF